MNIWFRKKIIVQFRHCFYNPNLHKVTVNFIQRFLLCISPHSLLYSLTFSSIYVNYFLLSLSLSIVFVLHIITKAPDVIGIYVPNRCLFTMKVEKCAHTISTHCAVVLVRKYSMSMVLNVSENI